MDETIPTRIYNDGPCFPDSPLAVESEKAYREWFAKTATGAQGWTQPNVQAFDHFMSARRVAKDKAVCGVDHGACLFRPDHPIEASKTRGQAQAAWIAIEGWRHFIREGFDTRTIRNIAMTGWNARVQRWRKGLLRPDQIVLPPRPAEDIDANTQDKLDEIRQLMQITYASLPRDADIRPRSLRRLFTQFSSLKRPVIHGLLRAGREVASPGSDSGFGVDGSSV